MNYSNDLLLADLSEEFEDMDFSYKQIDYNGILPCFFIETHREEKLGDFWMKISDFIAVNYQSRLTNDFSIWNIYLFFIVNNTIGNDLKYSIENDTFSSRKIVIEGNNDYNKILEKHILNNDIKIDESTDVENEFTPNPIFFCNVAHIGTKSKVTNDIKSAYSRIINNIKEADHEI